MPTQAPQLGWVRSRAAGGSDTERRVQLLDPKRYPAQEVFDLYRDRWEIELAYRELKSDVMAKAATLRSQTSEGVAQELWATLLMYNLVRKQMADVANSLGVEPLRISFIMSIRTIIDEWLWIAHASPGAVPRKLLAMQERLKRYVLPPRRHERRFPRAVLGKPRKYPKRKKTAQSLN